MRCGLSIEIDRRQGVGNGWWTVGSWNLSRRVGTMVYGKWTSGYILIEANKKDYNCVDGNSGSGFSSLEWPGWFAIVIVPACEPVGFL